MPACHNEDLWLQYQLQVLRRQLSCPEVQCADSFLLQTASLQQCNSALPEMGLTHLHMRFICACALTRQGLHACQEAGRRVSHPRHWAQAAMCLPWTRCSAAAQAAPAAAAGLLPGSVHSCAA